jgi:hypothetical protein
VPQLSRDFCPHLSAFGVNAEEILVFERNSPNRIALSPSYDLKLTSKNSLQPRSATFMMIYSQIRSAVGPGQNHLAVPGGYVVDALGKAAHPPATARWF